MKQLRQYLSGNMRQYGMVIALTVITLLFGILTDGNIFNAMNVSVAARARWQTARVPCQI